MSVVSFPSSSFIGSLAEPGAVSDTLRKWPSTCNLPLPQKLTQQPAQPRPQDDDACSSSSTSPHTPPMMTTSAASAQKKKQVQHGPLSRRRQRRERRRYVRAVLTQLASTATSRLPLCFRSSAVPSRLRSFVSAPWTPTDDSSSSSTHLRELFWAPTFQLEHGDEYAQVLLVSSSASPSPLSAADLQATLNTGAVASGRLSREQFAYQSDDVMTAAASCADVDDDGAHAAAVTGGAVSSPSGSGTVFDFGGSNESAFSSMEDLWRIKEQWTSELCAMQEAR